MRRRQCRQRRLERFTIVQNPQNEAPAHSEVEHSLPVMLLSRFPAVASHGRHWASGRVMHPRSNPIPTGDQTRTPAIPESFWTDHWDNANGLPNAIQIGSFSTRQPSQAMAEALGSSTNPSNFLLLEDAVNGAKGQTEAFRRHMSDSRLRRLINRSIGGDAAATSEMLESLQEVSCILSLLK
jgi:chitinase